MIETEKEAIFHGSNPKRSTNQAEFFEMVHYWCLKCKGNPKRSENQK